VEENKITVTLDNEYQINGLIDLLRQNYIDILSIVPHRVSLEDSFMQLIREGNNAE